MNTCFRKAALQHTVRPVAMAVHMACVALAAGWALAPAGAYAQAASPTAVVNADVPAGPLADALNRFALQAGVAIVVDAEKVKGKTSPGLKGSVSVEEGFRQLLAGSGYQLGRTAAGYVLVAPSAGATATPGAATAANNLPLVTVTASAESLTEGTGSFTTAGPVNAATGMDLTLRETPQSVTVITSERIEQQGLKSLVEVANQVPGVFYAGSGTPVGGRTEIYARGFNIDSYMIDGVNVPWEALGESERYGQSTLDTAIYDSVTVVRGATGLLSGAGDPSAAINLTRKRPTSTFHGSVEGTLGSWNQRRAVVDAGGPLNTAGNVRGRAVAAYDQGDTWVDNYDYQRGIVYGVLDVDLTPATLLSLSLEHGRNESTGAPWASAYGIPLLYSDNRTYTQATRNTTAAPHWAYLDTDRTTVSTSLKHRFSDDWSAAVTYIHSEFNSDMRRGMVNSIPISGAASTVRVLDLDMGNSVDAFDLRIDGKYDLWGRKHEVVAGFNASDATQVYSRSVYTVIPGAAQWTGSQLVYRDLDWANLPDDYPTRDNVTQQGIYAATRLRPTDFLSVIAGGRVSSWKTRYVELQAPYAVIDERSYSNEVAPYVGVVVDLSQSLSAYASYTEIFKPQTTRDINGNLLDPEQGKNYELGLKGAWFNGRLNAAVAVFETRKDNLAVRDGNNFTPTGDPAYRAESETEGRGWELEVAGQLMPGWQLQGGYSQFSIKDAKGERLNTSRPKQQFKLYTSYTPGMLPALTVGGGMRWQSETWGEGSTGFLREAYTIDSYTVFDLSARYELNKRLSVSANLNNVFNKSYRISYYDHSYGAERNVTATLKYQF
ncbi:TonB-dependent siderophore receptor [Uliginosibacterium sp. H1]|uniref:TonB-dependent siderophore receptor n=1 Tax=Uliginosibacterium sp. H1 TaxID=3114757 RepID=UPI002E18A966|nr:TonB-dependent siderophore receptor [Uliginosibacterium sp. H1]